MKYYLNNTKQPNGDHEVHTKDCEFCPTLSRTYLGEFTNCRDGVAEAKRQYPYRTQINGCKTCCLPCHTT